MRGISAKAFCATLTVLGISAPAWATLSQVDQTGDVIPNGAPIAATVNAFGASKGVDGLTIAAIANEDTGIVFLGTETFNGGSGTNAQLFAVSGFNSPIISIRLHTYLGDTQRVPGVGGPASVTVLSSTSSTTSLSSVSYPTFLGNFPLNFASFNTPSPAAAGELNPPGTHYATLAVSAPVGTQSLYFDFNGSDVGTRITEVQAYAPEPATLGVLSLAAVGLLRRRAR
jgi:hypothetical protein